MTTDTPPPMNSIPSSAEKGSHQLPSSPLPQTPTPMRGKRSIPHQNSSIPPKKRFFDNFSPDLNTFHLHDFWVSVWHNGERTSEVNKVATYTILAIYKGIGYEMNCEIHQNNDMSKIYKDDALWFKVSLTLPPRAAADLLEMTTVESMTVVVVFAPFPCASQTISAKDLEELQENPSPGPRMKMEIQAKPVTRGGRPFTWSLKKLINLNRCTAENKKRKVSNLTKHPLLEYLELNESLNKPIEEEELA
jgi:hypothetical protein